MSWREEEGFPEDLKDYIKRFNAAKSDGELKKVVEEFRGRTWLSDLPIAVGDITKEGNSAVSYDTAYGKVSVTFIQSYPEGPTRRILRVPTLEEFSIFGTMLVIDPRI